MGRFARYEFVQKIAVGGMAEVWAAQAILADGRATDVVVKRILPQFAGDEAFQSMLLGEAEVTARLRHPNIVPVLDWGHLDETCFLAMEHVKGLDGRQLLDACAMRRIAVPPAVALFAAGEIFKALDHAHRRTDERGRPLGIVHRDVSPSNVLFSVTGEVKLTDFGIARAKTRSSHTVAGQVRGKPRYMSPEQARSHEIDGRSDLFSTGLVLHELLTGKPVFPAADFLDEVVAIMEKGIPAPSQVNPALPPDLDALVLSFCERDLDRRPKTGAVAYEAIVDWALRHKMKLGPGSVAELVTSIVKPTQAAKPVQAKGATRIMRVDDLDGVARFATQPEEARLSAAPSKPPAPEAAGMPSTRRMAAPVSSDVVPSAAEDDGPTEWRRTAESAKETVIGALPTEDPEIQWPKESDTTRPDDPEITAAGADAYRVPTPPARGVARSTEMTGSVPKREDTDPVTAEADVLPGMPSDTERAPLRKRRGETIGLAGAIVVVLLAVGGASWWAFGRGPGPVASEDAPAPTLQLVFDTPSTMSVESATPVETSAVVAVATPPGTERTFGGVDSAVPTAIATATKRPRATATPSAAAKAGVDAPTPIPAGRGYLTVRAKPNGEITIDGQWAGSTPLTKHELPSGVHTVDVTSEDGRKASQKVTVLPDETTSVSLKLE